MSLSQQRLLSTQFINKIAMQKTDNWLFTILLQSMHLQDFFFPLHTYMSFFIVSSSSPNSALLSLIELTAVRQDCRSLYSSMSRGFNWCHRALNLSSSCWKACTLDSTLLFITSTFKDYSNNYYIVLKRIFTSRNDISLVQRATVLTIKTTFC